VVPSLFSPEERDKLAPLALDEDLDAPRSASEAALHAAAGRAKRESLQIRSLERLKQASVPQIMLPFLFEDASTPAAIARLAEHF
jgi:hypothetical protein